MSRRMRRDSVGKFAVPNPEAADANGRRSDRSKDAECHVHLRIKTCTPTGCLSGS